MSVMLENKLLVARFLSGEPALAHFCVSLPQIPHHFSGNAACQRLDRTQFPG